MVHNTKHFNPNLVLQVREWFLCFFPSKKDWFFTIVILGLSHVSVALYLLDSNAPTSALFVVCGFVFLLMWIWLGTGYKVGDGKIKIYYGPIRMTVKIKEIRKIEKVKGLLRLLRYLYKGLI